MHLSGEQHHFFIAHGRLAPIRRPLSLFRDQRESVYAAANELTNPPVEERLQ
jgi:hypothetical protein